jgi:hypothetical protein
MFEIVKIKLLLPVSLEIFALSDQSEDRFLSTAVTVAITSF